MLFCGTFVDTVVLGNISNYGSDQNNVTDIMGLDKRLNQSVVQRCRTEI